MLLPALKKNKGSRYPRRPLKVEDPLYLTPSKKELGGVTPAIVVIELGPLGGSAPATREVKMEKSRLRLRGYSDH